MSQRNFFPGPHIPAPDNDQIWNRHHPDTHLALGNGSYMLPLDNNVGSTAVLRSNGYPSTNFLNYATSSGTSHDPCIHLSSAASSSHFPPDQYSCVPPSGSSMIHPQNEIGRSEFKRKTPIISAGYNGLNTNGCYSDGSYSNPLQQKPLIMHQYTPMDPASSTHMHGSGNHVVVGDDAQRNVRSRHINPHLACSSSNMPHHFHAEGQLIHVPTVPMAPQRDPRFSYEGNHSVSGINFLNNSTVNNGAFHPNISQNRNTSSLPSHHDHLSQVITNNNFNPRSNPYWASSSHLPVGFSTIPLESTGLRGMESVASSRHSRPLFITGRSSYRNARARGSNSRFHGGYLEDHICNSSWSSEGTVMMGQSTLNNSRSWIDEHMDMRLNIDNMSYEELLALGERIGHVNTGLSDETISKCLEETTFCCPNDIQEQEKEKCVICLEEYKDQSKVGRLACRHDFHLRCVKVWLQIKNACPICKAAAFRDTSKENQL